MQFQRLEVIQFPYSGRSRIEKKSLGPDYTPETKTIVRNFRNMSQKLSYSIPAYKSESPRSFAPIVRSYSRLRRILLFYALAFGIFWRIIPSTASPAEPLFEIYESEIEKYTSSEILSSLNDWNGDIVWGASWVLDSLDSMYEATKDEKYIRMGQRVVQAIFDARDDKRGIKGLNGEISVFWSNKKYGIGKIEVRNENHEIFLILESIAYAGADKTVVSLCKENPKTLTIIAENRHLKIQEKYVRVRYDMLTKRINTVRTYDKLIWIKKFDPQKAEGFKCATNVDTDVYIYSWPTHHVGWIIAPILRWCWIVKKYKLSTFGDHSSKYMSLALESLTAKALEDSYIRETRWGYYKIPVGVPVWADGVIEPFNATNAFARAFFFAWKLTGNLAYLDRTRELINWWKKAWNIRRDRTVVWPYWVGPGADGWNANNAPGVNTQHWKGSSDASPTKYAANDLAMLADTLWEKDFFLTAADTYRVAGTVTRLLDDK